MEFAGEHLERVEVRSLLELRDWLEIHHGQAAGVWLVTFKKHTGTSYVSRFDVLDELLCWGWIDGRMMKLDEDRVMQLISPRRVHHWSQTYKVRVEKLELEGRMRAPGLAVIELAKRENLWDSLADVDELVVPEVLASQLEKADLRDEFDNLPASYRRNLLRWVKLAKRQETQDKRIAAIVDATLKGYRIPQM